MTLSFNIKGRGYWKASGFRLNHVWSSFFHLGFDLKSVLLFFFSGVCEKLDRLIEMINHLSNAPKMTAMKQKQLFYAVYLCDMFVLFSVWFMSVKVQLVLYFPAFLVAVVVLQA